MSDVCCSYCGQDAVDQEHMDCSDHGRFELRPRQPAEEPAAQLDTPDLDAVRRIAAKIVRAAELEDASVFAQTWARELISAGVAS